MSEVAIDRGSILPDPFTAWYQERPFQVAFAFSVLIHALLILLLPELRSVQIEPPQVLNVELVTAEPQAVPEQKPILQRPEPVRQPVVEPPPVVERPVPRPEPVIEPPPVREVLPEAPPPARAELAPPVPREMPREQPMVRNRPEPQPEHRVEIPQQKVMPQAPPDVLPPPPPARAEPRPIPQASPRIEPEIQQAPPPVAEVPPPVSVPRPVPPVARVEPPAMPELAPRVVEPRPEASPPPITERPAIQPPAPPVTAQPAPPPAMPAAPQRAEVSRELKVAYSQLLSSQIKRQQKYPPVAQRRGWEGTAEVQLKVAPDGRVTNIALARSTGREILDKEALEMVKRATPLPQAPHALRGQELTVTVPIVFRLQDS